MQESWLADLTVIQRSSGDMRLNPHIRVVALDGVYVAGTDGPPVFQALACGKPSASDSRYPLMDSLDDVPPRAHSSPTLTSFMAKWVASPRWMALTRFFTGSDE